MSLINATIKTGATWAATGGSDLAFTPDGRAIPDGVNLVVLADTNLVLRRSLAARATMPALPTKTGDYARLGRAHLTYLVPFIASDGKLYKQPVKIEMGFHPEYTDANKAAVINDATAFLADTDFANFWRYLVLN